MLKEYAFLITQSFSFPVLSSRATSDRDTKEMCGAPFVR